MPDYSKGQIYTIRFYDDTKTIYIGSTIQPLAKRFGGHKKQNKRDKQISLYRYINEKYNGDWSVCYIELYESYPCNNKQELDKREGEVQRKFKDDENYNLLNKCIAGRTQQEYYSDTIEYQRERNKKYKLENADKIKERYHNNIEKIKEQSRQYYLKNAEKIKERTKQYKKARSKSATNSCEVSTLS